MTLPRAQPGPTVVVCEDDPPTLELLCDHLLADRFAALAAPTASDALRLCHFNQPDLLLLDLNLPDASGLDVLREIRASEGATGSFDPGLPVIVLSGRSTDADRLRGLECGADDYVVKPFAIAEVVARMRAVLRRRDSRRSGPLRVGELVVDPSRREVRVAGRRVQLANKEFSLLRTLATDPTRVFTKAELLRDVWGFRSLGKTRTLDSHASRLRRKLDPESGRYVLNCWGVGYRLIDAPEGEDAGLDW
jgi:DNA-binding response OmpR family regulator